MLLFLCSPRSADAIFSLRNVCFEDIIITTLRNSRRCLLQLSFDLTNAMQGRWRTFGCIGGAVSVSVSAAALASTVAYARGDGKAGLARNKRAPAARVPRRPGALPQNGEPLYTRSQVSEMDGGNGRRMWVTYLDGVYDVTDFQHVHPGGMIIKQAAGADVEPFWRVWSYHHLVPTVGMYLDKLRIGRLVEDDIITNSKEEGDPYALEPVRSATKQTTLVKRPYCSETPNDVLASSYLTTADALYVRNHAPVPECAYSEDGNEIHEIVFERALDGGKDTILSIAELKLQFPFTVTTSILQCAGNRASEDLAATGKSGFTGTPFAHITQGMVGNAEWAGISLADVLVALYPEICAGLLKGSDDIEWHVVLEGADGYSASTPLARILKKENECLLATHMNGEPLTPDHGYPVRALLPGIAGARNVKWLESIRLQKEPSDSPWNSYYYKNKDGEHIHELPMQSMILKAHVATDDPTIFNVSGVAYGGGSGNPISRVQLSTDNGKTFVDATLLVDEMSEKTASSTTGADSKMKTFGWVRWQCSIPIASLSPPATSVCCRAIDAAGTMQPKVSAKERGYIYNGWSTFDVLL